MARQEAAEAVARERRRQGTSSSATARALDDSLLDTTDGGPAAGQAEGASVELVGDVLEAIEPALGDLVRGLDEGAASAAALAKEGTFQRNLGDYLLNQKRFLRERFALIQRSRADWMTSMKALAREPDPAEREKRYRVQLLVKDALDNQARRLNEDVRQLKALRRFAGGKGASVHSSLETEGVDGMEDDMDGGVMSSLADVATALEHALSRISPGASGQPRRALAPRHDVNVPSSRRAGAGGNGALISSGDAAFGKLFDTQRANSRALEEYGGWLNTFRDRVSEALTMVRHLAKEKKRRAGGGSVSRGGVVRLDDGTEFEIVARRGGRMTAAASS